MVWRKSTNFDWKLQQELLITERKVVWLEKNVKTALQEESADPKENSPPHPNFAKFTYVSSLYSNHESQRL
jgi:hypothetical protein